MVDKKKEEKANLEKAKEIINKKRPKKINPNAKVNLSTYLSENPITDYYINALIVATFRSNSMMMKEWKEAIRERINKKIG